MDPLGKVFYFAMNLVLPMTVGYVLRKTGWSGSKTLYRVMVINLLGVTPVLTCLSFWKVRIDLGDAMLPVLGALMQILPAAIAFLIARRTFQDPQEQGGYILSTMFSNRSIVGILSVYILYGTEGYAYSRMVMLLGPLIFYMFGFPLARYYYELSIGKERKKRPSLYSVFFTKNQLPVLGLFAGFLLNRVEVALPDIATPIFTLLISINAWFYLVPVGFDLDFGEMKHYWKKVFALVPIKFVLMPLIFYLLSTFIGLTGERLGTVVVLSFTPAAVGAIVAAKLNNLDTRVPMAAYLLTTAVYLLFVFPVLLLLL